MPVTEMLPPERWLLAEGMGRDCKQHKFQAIGLPGLSGFHNEMCFRKRPGVLTLEIHVAGRSDGGGPDTNELRMFILLLARSATEHRVADLWGNPDASKLAPALEKPTA